MCVCVCARSAREVCLNAEQSTSEDAAVSAPTQDSSSIDGGATVERGNSAVLAGVSGGGGGGGDERIFSAWQTVPLTVPEVPKAPVVDIEGKINALILGFTDSRGVLSHYQKRFTIVLHAMCVLETKSQNRWQMSP